ncbi:MAG: dipeptidyl-peptidase-4 [Planctomycetota bacterium]|jgi:dipeptidyl-peptidase-4
MRNSKYLFLVLLLPCFLSAALFAQGTQKDYERAKKISRTYNQAFDSRLDQVHWFPDGKGFWYGTTALDRRFDYHKVDLATGKSSPLFERGRLARAIAAAEKNKPSPSIVVLNAVLTPSGVRVRLLGDHHLWDVRLPQYSAIKKSLGAEPRWKLKRSPNAKRSGRGSAPTNLLFWNDTKDEVEIFWANDQSKLKKYAEVKPGEFFNTSTFAGHAWAAADKKGTVIGRWVATKSPRWIGISQDKAKSKKPRKSDKSKVDKSKEKDAKVVFKNHDLYLEDSKTGKLKQLSGQGSESNYFGGRVHWSPNRRHALVFRTKPVKRRRVSFVESAPKDQLEPKLHTFDYTKPGDDLTQSFPWLIDVAKKSVKELDRQLFENPFRMNRVRWQANSSAVTFFYNERGHGTVRVISVDAKFGKVKAVVNEETKSFVDYAGKFFLRFVNRDKDIVWMSERSGWNHLYLMSARSGKVRNAITAGEWVVRSVERIDEDAQQIYFWAGGINQGEDPYHLHYCRVDLNGKNLTVLTEGDGTHKISVSPDGQYLVDTWSRVDLPPHRAVRRMKDGSKVCDLGACDTLGLDQVGWQRPERFVAKGRDGKTDIWGILFRPSNFDPKKKYPVIEAIYAGPHSAHVPKEFRAFHGPQKMAELGFLVVKIDGMGTSHRSKAFHDMCWKNIGDAGFPDRIAWIKALAKKEPAMDLTRVGIYGGSAGGQNAMRALIAHHDFYHVAVADCGCHDNRMDKIWWNELWMSYPIGPHYAESSNVTQAHRMKGKLLLLVGEVDRNVDPASTMQVVDALIKADKDFDMLVIPGAGHGAAGTPYGARRQQDYFVRHLLGVEPRL